jgi:glutamate--cysteine ligase
VSSFTPSLDLNSERPHGLTPDRLLGMRRGIEKESLRALPGGSLALTPHPSLLGSALTHPRITTDYSESQVELITGVHAGVEACLAELAEIHQYTYRTLRSACGDEMLWVSSMPCLLPTDETIPLGRYGSSNIGRAKSVYRMGLGHRYGRRMQTISGIHYNWSLPGAGNEDYFGLIRNFRRHAFLLLYLFGASPALHSDFVQGRAHELMPLRSDSGTHTGDGTPRPHGEGTLHMPHGTSLRMGKLGYQSEAQASLAVSYNSLESYAASLHDALTRPWPAYEALGVLNPGGDYIQLATSLLQIENEFYGTIRPKRTIFQGERPLHALRERGVEYVEVRLLDLDPFEPIGINARTLRFLDVFLLHCLSSTSPPDTPQEIAEIGRNQHLTAARGREPGLQLWRGGRQTTPLRDWALELLDACAPLAAQLDAAHASTEYSAALQAARDAVHDPALLPSARVLRAIQEEHDGSFLEFVRARSHATRADLLARPWDAATQQTRYEAMAQTSVREQAAIEAADTLPFEEFRKLYVSPSRLGQAMPVSAVAA